MSNYKKLLVATTISSFGSWLNLIAMISLIYNMTGSGMALGFVFLIKFLPRVLISSLVSPIIDKYNKRKISMYCEFIAGILIISIAFLSNISIPLVFVLYFFQNGIISIFAATKMALIPNLIDDESDFIKASSTLSIINNVKCYHLWQLGGYY